MSKHVPQRGQGRPPTERTICGRDGGRLAGGIAQAGRGGVRHGRRGRREAARFAGRSPGRGGARTRLGQATGCLLLRHARGVRHDEARGLVQKPAVHTDSLSAGGSESRAAVSPPADGSGGRAAQQRPRVDGRGGATRRGHAGLSPTMQGDVFCVTVSTHRWARAIRGCGAPSCARQKVCFSGGRETRGTTTGPAGVAHPDAEGGVQCDMSHRSPDGGPWDDAIAFLYFF